MNDRDEFALMAAEVLLERIDPPFGQETIQSIARRAYAFADAMLEARDKGIEHTSVDSNDRRINFIGDHL